MVTYCIELAATSVSRHPAYRTYFLPVVVFTILLYLSSLVNTLCKLGDLFKSFL